MAVRPNSCDDRKHCITPDKCGSGASADIMECGPRVHGGALRSRLVMVQDGADLSGEGLLAFPHQLIKGLCRTGKIASLRNPKKEYEECKPEFRKGLLNEKRRRLQGCWKDESIAE